MHISAKIVILKQSYQTLQRTQENKDPFALRVRVKAAYLSSVVVITDNELGCKIKGTRDPFA